MARNTSRSTNQRLRGPVALVAALLVAAAAWLATRLATESIDVVFSRV